MPRQFEKKRPFLREYDCPEEQRVIVEQLRESLENSPPIRRRKENPNKKGYRMILAAAAFVKIGEDGGEAARHFLEIAYGNSFNDQRPNLIEAARALYNQSAGKDPSRSFCMAVLLKVLES